MKQDIIGAEEKTIISVKGVCKYFPGPKAALKVLDNIDLDIYRGEILTVLGPSGCGKSTLLRQIAGFDGRDAGSIHMNGQEVVKPDVKRIMIFQDFNQLFPWKTVLDNVLYPLTVNKLGESDDVRRKTAGKYLRLVELGGFEQSYPFELSGGMKQKAAMARALALRPEVLLMDEPFGSLDALTRISLQNLLLRVWRQTGVTIVFVTHDIQEAVLLSDRIAVMGGNFSGIREVIANRLPRPRTVGEEGFSAIYRQVFSFLDLYHPTNSS